MRRHFEVGETAVTVLSDDEFIPAAEEAVFEAREILLKKISQDGFFKTTYYPYAPEAKDHPLIRRMCQASELAGVGPMAGVAGAVASYAVERMSEAGASFAIVENGGDIALKIDRDVTVGMFQDDPKFRDVALSVPKRDGIFGICSSSGRIGPSVSLGRSGICTVISNDVILADACATALGNLVVTGEIGEMEDAVENIASVEGVETCIAVANGHLAMCGEEPKFVRASFGADGASRILF